MTEHSTHRNTDDTRVVFGARCSWWGDIGDVGKTPRNSRGFSLPCCPHCKGMLFETDNPEIWWKGVDKFEADNHPGYRAFITWSKGQCFPNGKAALAAYEAATGIKVDVS